MHWPRETYGFQSLDVVATAGDLVCTHPFWDRRVVDFAFALPDAERWHGTDYRWLEGRALRTVLPEAIANRRSKAELSSVYVAQLRALLLRELAPRLRVVDLGWVAKDFIPNAALADGAEWPVMRATWSALALEAWAKTL